MTTTSPARARLSGPRRLAAALASLAALVGLVALVVAGPDAARAALVADGASDPHPFGFTMAPGGDGVVAEGRPVVISLSARNTTAVPAGPGDVTVTASRTALADRAAVRSWLAGESLDQTETPWSAATTTMPALDPYDETSTSVTIDAEELEKLTPGVYPLRADYSSARGTVTSVSVLVVPGDAGTGALGVVVPLTAPPLSDGLLTADELTELTASGGALRVALDAVSGTDAVLAVDPAIAAAIRVLGTSAPDSARTWLDDLMSLPNSRFALQFGDADLATQVGAGLKSPLEVRTLTGYMTESDFADVPQPTPTATPTGTADATSDPSASTLPTRDQLLDIGAESRPVYWPATGTASGDVVGTLGAVRVEDEPAVTLVASSSLTGDADAVPAWTRVGDAQVLAYDADASAALRTASMTEAPTARSAAMAAASAYAALAATAAPGAPLVVVVDRAPSRAAESMRATVLGAVGLAGRSATDLDVLTAGTGRAARMAQAELPTPASAGLTRMLEDEVDLGSFSSILKDPSVLTGPERASILQLSGAGWRDEPTASASAVDAHLRGTQDTLDAVAVVPPSDISLYASSAPLLFSVRNDLPWPVSLVLVATPNDPRLQVQNATPVEAGPQQNTRVKVPVQARVGSGESTLNVQLRSPTMVSIGDPLVVHVAVRAEWESVGIIVLATVVGGMLVLGIVRTVRKRRPARIAGTGDDDDRREDADG